MPWLLTQPGEDVTRVPTRSKCFQCKCVPEDWVGVGEIWCVWSTLGRLLFFPSRRLFRTTVCLAVNSRMSLFSVFHLHSVQTGEQGRVLVSHRLKSPGHPDVTLHLGRHSAMLSAFCIQQAGCIKNSSCPWRPWAALQVRAPGLGELGSMCLLAAQWVWTRPPFGYLTNTGSQKGF